MAQSFTAGFLDRLCAAGDDAVGGIGSGQTLTQFKDGVARDLESLLNTRCVLSKQMQSAYPECGNSILNYGLMDFSHLCLGSSVDRETICAAVKAAIERHEPRLSRVQASLRIAPGSTCRLDFVIEALLRTQAAIEPVQFDAQLDSSTQQYSIKGLKTAAVADAA